jgi:hypothetical protein
VHIWKDYINEKELEAVLKKNIGLGVHLRDAKQQEDYTIIVLLSHNDNSEFMIS